MPAVFLNTRTMVLICWTSGCWAFSFGLGSQVVTHYAGTHYLKTITHYLNVLNLEEINTVIGLTHACYYVGLALGSCAIPWLNRRLGSIHCATLGLFLSGLTLAFFPW